MVSNGKNMWGSLQNKKLGGGQAVDPMRLTDAFCGSPETDSMDMIYILMWSTQIRPIRPGASTCNCEWVDYSWVDLALHQWLMEDDCFQRHIWWQSIRW